MDGIWEKKGSHNARAFQCLIAGAVTSGEFAWGSIHEWSVYAPGLPAVL